MQVQLRLPGGFIARVEQGRGLGAVLRAQAFLLSSLSVFNVERAAELAAVEDETMSHNSDFLSGRYETVRGFGCIRLHQTGSESRLRE